MYLTEYLFRIIIILPTKDALDLSDFASWLYFSFLSPYTILFHEESSSLIYKPDLSTALWTEQLLSTTP